MGGQLSNLPILSDSVLSVISDDPATLLLRLSDDLMSGQMSTAMAAVIGARLAEITAGDLTSQRIQRVTEALYYVMSSPEYTVQK